MTDDDARAALAAALTITQHHGDGSHRAAAMLEVLSPKWRLVPAVPVDAERLREALDGVARLSDDPVDWEIYRTHMGATARAALAPAPSEPSRRIHGNRHDRDDTREDCPECWAAAEKYAVPAPSEP